MRGNYQEGIHLRIRHRTEDRVSGQKGHTTKYYLHRERIHGITDSSYLQVMKKKNEENYLGAVKLANSIIVYRRIFLG